MPAPRTPALEPRVSGSLTRSTPRPLARLRRAWTRLRWPAIVLQSLLLLLIGALLFAWISIPDSDATEITLTVVLALGGLAAVAWAQTALFHLIYARRPAAVRLRAVLSTLLSLLLFVVVNFLFTTAVAVLQAQLAARLTSALLLSFLLLVVNLLVWFALSVLALALLTVCVEGAAGIGGDSSEPPPSHPPFTRSLAVLRSPGTWPPLFATVAFLTLATQVALAWHPLATETGARIFGYMKAAVLWPFLGTGIAFLCSLISTLLRDQDSAPALSAGVRSVQRSRPPRRPTDPF